LVRSLVLAEPALLPWAHATPEGAADSAAFITNVWDRAVASFRRDADEEAMRLTMDFFVGKGEFDRAPAATRLLWMENSNEWRALTTSSNASCHSGRDPRSVE
jgi:hypothetical protein